MMLITHTSSLLSAALIQILNNHNFNYLVITDNDPTWKPPTNWRTKAHLPPTPLPDWFERNEQELEFAFCLDTTDNQTEDSYFQTLWQQCVDHQVPLIFRTTAARSAWVAEQSSAPFFWAGLRTSSFGTANGEGTPSPSDNFSEKLPETMATRGNHSPTYARDVAQAAYFLVHHRQHSGEFAVDNSQAHSFK